jgi:CBS domain-containing protein
MVEMKRIVSVKEAMSPKVLTVGPNTTVAKAAKLMAQRSVGSVVIVKSKKPLGILTERDLLMKVISTDQKPSAVQVKEIMSSPIITVPPDTEITEALRIMAKNKIRRLPVVTRGNLVGIVTTTDIMAISPELIEVASRPEETAGGEIEESVCESCGEVTTTIYEVNGMWVCDNCRDAMSG